MEVEPGTVRELVDKLHADEEYKFSREILEHIASVPLAAGEDVELLCKGLVRHFWKMPKLQHQMAWIEEAIGQLRRHGQETFLDALGTMRRTLGSQWGLFGIRRMAKFKLLLQRVVEEEVALRSGCDLREFFGKGPSAEFDSILMGGAVKSRRHFAQEELQFLIDHLIQRDGTYFVSFFRRSILPKIQRDKVPPELARKALDLGKKKSTSDNSRAILYAIYQSSLDAN